MKSMIITAISLAASVGLHTSSASAEAVARGDCKETVVKCPPETIPLGGTAVSCGACKTISAGTTINWSLVITPGGVGGSVGGSITVTEGYTVCAGECNVCNFALSIIGASYVKKVCWKNPWLPWNNRYQVTTYEQLNPGTPSITNQCHTSEEISCMCRAAGHDCECGSDDTDPPIPEDQGRRRHSNQGVISHKLTSLDVTQFLATNTSDRLAEGMKGLSRHDLAVLDACLPLDELSVGNTRIALVFDGGVVETHERMLIRDTIAALSRAMVTSGANLDVDGNGVVDQADLEIVTENIGAQGGGDRPFDHYADVDANGRVDEKDLLLVSAAL